MTALAQLWAHLDAIAADVLSKAGQTPACGKGCAYCCHFKVEATPVEVFRIVGHVRKHFSDGQVRRMLKEARSNAAQTKALGREERLKARLKCPFLVDSRCSIYAVRPLKCRTFHSIDVEICRNSFDRKDTASAPNGYIRPLVMKQFNAVTGFNSAMREHGLDGAAYDFSSAVVEAFANSKLRKKFEKGRRVFSASRSAG